MANTCWIEFRCFKSRPESNYLWEPLDNQFVLANNLIFKILCFSFLWLCRTDFISLKFWTLFPISGSQVDCQSPLNFFVINGNTRDIWIYIRNKNSILFNISFGLRQQFLFINIAGFYTLKQWDGLIREAKRSFSINSGAKWKLESASTCSS